MKAMDKTKIKVLAMKKVAMQKAAMKKAMKNVANKVAGAQLEVAIPRTKKMAMKTFERHKKRNQQKVAMKKMAMKDVAKKEASEQLEVARALFQQQYTAQQVMSAVGSFSERSIARMLRKGFLNCYHHPTVTAYDVDRFNLPLCSRCIGNDE